MAFVELPKDAEGREIPLDTEAMYDANGKKVHITSFTYRCDVHGLWSQWKVFSQDITGEKDGMLPADSLYLTTPDSWEKLEEDLGKIANHQTEVVCPYYDREIKDCEGCRLEGYDCSCSHAFLKDVMARIRKLRGED